MKVEMVHCPFCKPLPKPNPECKTCLGKGEYEVRIDVGEPTKIEPQPGAGYGTIPHPGDDMFSAGGTTPKELPPREKEKEEHGLTFNPTFEKFFKEKK